jgi:hypothetical protein
MEHKYWITLRVRTKCHAILNYVILLIIEVRSLILNIFLISFLELHHCCPSIHICGVFSIQISQYHVAHNKDFTRHNKSLSLSLLHRNWLHR